MQPVDLVGIVARHAFQSMHPIKDATIVGKEIGDNCMISIHAPYKGCNNRNDP